MHPGRRHRALSPGRADGRVHLFARWLPREVLIAALRRRGVTLVVHPIESIRSGRADLRPALYPLALAAPRCLVEGSGRF